MSVAGVRAVEFGTYSPALAGTHCAYPQMDGQAELIWVAGYIPTRFTRSKTVIHTNRARLKLTSFSSLIETNALPLSQTATGEILA